VAVAVYPVVRMQITRKNAQYVRDLKQTAIALRLFLVFLPYFEGNECKIVSVLNLYMWFNKHI
jgi:hypothetical protein